MVVEGEMMGILTDDGVRISREIKVELTSLDC